MYFSTFLFARNLQTNRNVIKEVISNTKNAQKVSVTLKVVLCEKNYSWILMLSIAIYFVGRKGYIS